MTARLEKVLVERWYGGHGGWPAQLLRPLSWIYASGIVLRRMAYELGLFAQYKLSVPVIVVGNITVGGTGKTPLVIWLVEFLRQAGYSPCVVSRGYRAKATRWPQQVRADSDPTTVGDEALVIAQHCRCPMAVSPDRADAAKALLRHERCDVVVSDDGLQHYALRRDIEIAVIDGVRRFGNGKLLPAGPLREPVRRLNGVDMVVCNGLPSRGEFGMRVVPERVRSLCDDTVVRDVTEFRGATVHAVAGIGYPERFFAQLRRLGMKVVEHQFPDHHRYQPTDIRFDDAYPVLMTEKDAVKCRRFANPSHWYLPVRLEMPEQFGQNLLALLNESKTDG